MNKHGKKILNDLGKKLWAVREAAAGLDVTRKVQ
jgi:hypothetical protein